MIFLFIYLCCICVPHAAFCVLSMLVMQTSEALGLFDIPNLEMLLILKYDSNKCYLSYNCIFAQALCQFLPLLNPPLCSSLPVPAQLIQCCILTVSSITFPVLTSFTFWFYRYQGGRGKVSQNWSSRHGEEEVSCFTCCLTLLSLPLECSFVFPLHQVTNTFLFPRDYETCLLDNWALISFPFINRFLVPRDMSVGQFIHVLSGRLHLAPGKALFVFVENTLPQTCKDLVTSFLLLSCLFKFCLRT